MATELLDNPAVSTDAERQIVALHLGGEVYGVDIAHIHTIITPQSITHVPKAPAFVRGVMNLRGRIIPVIDLRDRFGLEPIEEERKKAMRIVIVDVQGIMAGLIVDAVSEVLRLSASAIDPPSQLVASLETECITGIGRIASGGDNKADDRLIILLDVYKTLTTCAQDADALTKLQKAA
ncbi:chemotaxis protein CheW [Capsulimonas corticalis]|uniref:Chemotaxis protein CheW n=1 Tax=Capsulimonas corticalis TaxID=2219043 RepID=A0A402CU83_9BACT|nr:chemotaxis protein CheW [Capsulimonas corticalis]BDI28874.1 chemotaxis protein CheW [Capsulimonas corticalis]